MTKQNLQQAVSTGLGRLCHTVSRAYSDISIRNLSFHFSIGIHQLHFEWIIIKDPRRTLERMYE